MPAVPTAPGSGLTGGTGTGATGAATPEAGLVEGWLAELGIVPVERAERDGVLSWDLVLDGERRRDIRLTLILVPGIGILVWAQYAPPLNDAFRKSYRQLLRWNDELLFAKFGLGEDERLVLSTELPVGSIDRDGLGTALCRLVLICDALLDASAHWISFGRPIPAATGPGRNRELLDRYRERVGELGVEP